MITNQVATSRETNASQPAPQDDKSVLAPAEQRAKPTEIVISAYMDGARRGNGAAVKAFDAAVGAYIACYPGTHPDVAARIVADIISHRS
jgi:hypothetical protein